MSFFFLPILIPSFPFLTGLQQFVELVGRKERGVSGVVDDKLMVNVSGHKYAASHVGGSIMRRLEKVFFLFFFCFCFVFVCFDYLMELLIFSFVYEFIFLFKRMLEDLLICAKKQQMYSSKEWMINRFKIWCKQVIFLHLLLFLFVFSYLLIIQERDGSKQ